MNKMTKSSLALLLVVVMLAAFVPALSINASAATSDVSYVYDSTGKYIYNWGERGDVATFLSPNAEDFYTGNNTYDVLSTYAGGTSTSSAPNSALYKALKNLMVSAHSYQTSYSATKDLYRYTDCQNSGGKISSFYSGNLIGPAWGEGSWNREHTWPNSKGLGGNDENDIMMLRPTSTSENSSRGNTAYGQSSGYYNPNSESGGKYDLRGDVARIFLYVYVRWGNTSYAWGKSGVMESVDVLLQWMEEDPVDTWELGRNDSVESITGTRNVFVDYPEFAFLLFGEEIPADMTTPSGSASSSKCDHNNFDAGVVIAATCTEGGYTIYTCMTSGCGYSYKTNTTSETGHSYSNGTCVSCGEAEPKEPEKATYATEVEVGKAYKLGIYSTEKTAEYYFTGSMSGFYGATDTDYAKGVDVYAETTTGGYRLYFMNGSQKQYINLVLSGTHYNFTYSTTATSVYTWDSARHSFYTTVNGEICYIGTYGSYVTMSVLRSSMISDTDYFAHFYTTDASSSGGNNSGSTTCQHNYTVVITVPTCTTGGYTTYTCTLCSDTYTGDKVSATGHSYSNGACVDCGASKPIASSTAKISFEDTANRTSFSKTQQIWEQNGIKIVNDKASSNVEVADYKNPARFYAGSNLTIYYPGITKIEIDCTGLADKYVSGWLNVSGATVTNNGGIITIELSSAVNSLTYTSLSAQCRAYSITVYTAGGAVECNHSNTKVVGAVSATCTESGHTGKTVCADCGDIISQGNSTPANGHTEVSHDGKAATCTQNGWEAYVTCEHCDYTTYVEIPASGEHSYSEWTVIKAPTCTESGQKERECENCGTKEHINVEPGHDWVEEDDYRFCGICGEVEEYDDIIDGDVDHSQCRGSLVDTILTMIFNIIRSILGLNQKCVCGADI